MTNTISRLRSTFETWSFKYNCYEAVHPWTPFCSDSALELGCIVFGEAIKLYTPLYLFTQLMQRSYDYEAFKRTSQSIIRSTTFISANAFFAMFLFCASQHFTGKFYYHVVANLPGFLASSMAVLIEKPHRRSSLAFYCANVASEALFRIWVSRGYFKPVNYGQVYIFTLSMATLMLLARRRGFENDPLSAAIKLIVGPEEAGTRRTRTRVRPAPTNTRGAGMNDATPKTGPKLDKHKHNHDSVDSEQQQEIQDEQLVEPLENLVEAIDVIAKQQEFNKNICSISGEKTTKEEEEEEDDDDNCDSFQAKMIRTFGWLKQLLSARHSLCPHQAECSCLYYVLNASSRAFLIGCAGQFGLRLLTKAPLLLTNASNQNKTKFELIFGGSRPLIDAGLFKIGIFLSTFSGLFKGSNCFFRWTLNKSNAYTCFLSGLIAGPALAIYPSPTVALYVLWKCLEVLFNEANRQGYIKHKELYIVLLYGIATNQLFYSALMDPSHMKRSYMSFLDKISHNKLHMVNRTILDIFGTKSSSAYEGYFPDLHPRFMSDAFLGSIWIWMLDNKFQVATTSKGAIGALL